MAIDLNRFKKKAETRLPILFLVEENHIASDFAVSIVEILQNCQERNILAELMVLSFGLDWTFRYPKLKNNKPPYFANLENVDLNIINQVISGISGSYQAHLDSALDLTKAILDDPETTKSGRYKPIVIIITSRTPAKGWEKSLDSLLNDGRSSNAQVYWIKLNKDGNEDNPVKNYKEISFKEASTDMLYVCSQASYNLVKEHVSFTKEPNFYLRNSKFYKLAQEIVSSFKLEPLNEVPEEDPVEFDTPGIDGVFGDGADAKGDGIV